MNMPQLSALKSPRQTQIFPLQRVSLHFSPTVTLKSTSRREARKDTAAEGPRFRPKKFQVKLPGPPTDQLGLVISEPFEKSPHQRVRVRCDCGTEKDVLVNTLRKKDSRSCGCLCRDHARARLTKHGEVATRLYGIWISMWRRCRDSDFKNYGDRGITVCNEWRQYESFRDWAKSAGYNDALTLDRIDNDKGYCPKNCRFVTRVVQSQNRRKLSRNTSGYIGVFRDYNRWQAQASHSGRQVYLGRYDTAIEAAKARDAYVSKHYESPTLNFPKSEASMEALQEKRDAHIQNKGFSTKKEPP